MSTFENVCLKDLKNLEVVRLRSNNFSSLPASLFHATPKLRLIKLLDNKQNLTELPNGLFANLTALKSLTVTHIGLLKLLEDVFWGSPNLSNLTINQNYLMTLPRNIFQNANELYNLTLSSNGLTKLPDGLFKATKNLTFLDLSKNHLTSINE